MTDSADPFVTQVGGDHYCKMAIQPAVYCHRNGIGYLEGVAIGYLSRWRAKGGVEDLRKAAHTIEMLIALESAFSENANQAVCVEGFTP